jgi:S-adenosylmethionine:tRNA ribosyltransferase-isomerase
MKYSLSDFDFDLPDALIAQMPLPDRTASRLLHVDGEQLVDRHFSDVIDQLAAGDLLVFNDTRVLKARFFGVKETGGKVQLLVERVLSNTDDNRSVLVQMRASKSPLPGSKIRLADAFDVVWVNGRANFSLCFFQAIFLLCSKPMVACLCRRISNTMPMTLMNSAIKRSITVFPVQSLRRRRAAF